MNKLGSILTRVSLLSIKRRFLTAIQRSATSFSALKLNYMLTESIEDRNHFKCNSYRKSFYFQRRKYASNSSNESSVDDLSEIEFEKYCSETLEQLSDYFDELVETYKEFDAADVVYQDGVLTVSLGKNYGTYVINKQTPNKQIWLSSPNSGPKRFDFNRNENENTGYWFYKHSNQILHDLLNNEIGKLLGKQLDFHLLPFGSKH